MDYKKRYEVRMRDMSTGREVWIVLAVFSSETDAERFMVRYSEGISGTWRVVRVSEVTVGGVAHG